MSARRTDGLDDSPDVEGRPPLAVDASRGTSELFLNLDEASLVTDAQGRLAVKASVVAAATGLAAKEGGGVVVEDSGDGGKLLSLRLDGETLQVDAVSGALEVQVFPPLFVDPEDGVVLHHDDASLAVDPSTGTLSARLPEVQAPLTLEGRTLGVDVDEASMATDGGVLSARLPEVSAPLKLDGRTLSIDVDDATLVIDPVAGHLKAAYSVDSPLDPTAARVTLEGTEFGLSNVASEADVTAAESKAESATGAVAADVELFKTTLWNPAGIHLVPPGPHPLWGSIGALTTDLAVTNGVVGGKQNSHQVLTDLSSATPFVAAPLDVRDDLKAKRFVSTDTGALGGPSMTGRSAGTRMVVWPGNFGGANTDMGFGVEPNHLWMSSYSPDQGIKWYTGDVLRMHLQGTTGDVHFTGAIGTPRFVTQYDVRETLAPAQLPGQRWAVGFGSWNMDGLPRWADQILLNGWSDASGGNTNLLSLRKDAIGLRIWQGPFGGTAPFSTYREALLRDPAGAVEGTVNFLTRPTFDGAQLATSAEVTAGAFSTFANDAWINSAEGAARFFFATNGDTILRAPNSVFFLRNGTNTTSLLRVDGEQVLFGNPTNGVQKLAITNTDGGTGAFVAHYLSTSAGSAVHFLNGPGRTDDGGASGYTIRNDTGLTRIQARGGKGIVIAADTGAVSCISHLASGGNITVGTDSALLLGGGYVENKFLHAYWDGSQRAMDICMPGDYRGYGPSNPTPRMILTANEMTVTYTKQATSEANAALIVKGGLGVALQVRAGQAFICNVGAGGTFHYVMQNAASNRWAIGLTNTESGTDTGSDFAIWCNKNDGSQGTVYNPFTINRATGVANFAARPTFGGNALALLSEVTGGGGTFTTFNNDAWINSADGRARFFFATNSNTYFASPDNFTWRTNGDTDNNAMVLDASGVLTTTSTGTGYGTLASFRRPALTTGSLSLEVGVNALPGNSGQLTFGYFGSGNTANQVNLAFRDRPGGLSVQNDGSVYLLNSGGSRGYNVAAGIFAHAEAAGAYFPDAQQGNICLRGANVPLLLGTSPTRNADLRIESNGTVNFRATPAAAGSPLVTTGVLDARLSTDIASALDKRKTYSWEYYDSGTSMATDGAASQTRTLPARVPLSRGKRTHSHLTFHVSMTGYIATANQLTQQSLLIYWAGDGAYHELGNRPVMVNSASNHVSVSWRCSTRDNATMGDFYLRDNGFITANDIVVRFNTTNWSFMNGQSCLQIHVTEEDGGL